MKQSLTFLLFLATAGVLVVVVSGQGFGLCKNKGDYHCGKENGKEESGRCIPAEFVCDGTYDCGDGNDEDGCPDKNPKLKDLLAEFPAHDLPRSAAHSPRPDPLPTTSC